MKILIALFCALLLLSGCYEELDWREWHAEDRSFVLFMPDKPKPLSREVTIGDTRLQLHMHSAEIEGMAFGVAYADVPAGASLNLVKDARDALVRNIEGRILSAKLVDVKGAKGMEFRAEGRSGETPMLMAARVLRDDKRFYQIVFVGRQDRAEDVDTAFFLESFKPLR
jgi:hypothetical protein